MASVIRLLGERRRPCTRSARAKARRHHAAAADESAPLAGARFQPRLRRRGRCPGRRAVAHGLDARRRLASQLSPRRHPDPSLEARVPMIELPPDFRDVLVELADAGAAFVVIGGYAVAFHGHVRATKDIDLLVKPSADNAARVFRALSAFGAPLDAFKVRPEDLAERASKRSTTPPNARSTKPPFDSSHHAAGSRSIKRS